MIFEWKTHSFLNAAHTHTQTHIQYIQYILIPIHRFRPTPDRNEYLWLNYHSKLRSLNVVPEHLCINWFFAIDSTEWTKIRILLNGNDMTIMPVASCQKAAGIQFYYYWTDSMNESLHSNIRYFCFIQKAKRIALTVPSFLFSVFSIQFNIICFYSDFKKQTINAFDK